MKEIHKMLGFIVVISFILLACWYYKHCEYISNDEWQIGYKIGSFYATKGEPISKSPFGTNRVTGPKRLESYSEGFARGFFDTKDYMKHLDFVNESNELLERLLDSPINSLDDYSKINYHYSECLKIKEIDKRILNKLKSKLDKWRDDFANPGKEEKDEMANSF